MMFLFRLLKIRYVGALLLIGIIASGNGEAVFTITRTALDATSKAVELAEGIYSAADKAAGAVTKDTGAKPSSTIEGKEPSSAKGSNAEPGSFKISLSDGGEPVRWCASQVEVVINDSQAPAGARKDLEAALSRISALSGIRFVVVGESDRIPDKNYHLSPGSPYPPVLIAWAYESQTDMLNPNISAAAVANPAETDGGLRYVTGSLAINVDHDVLYRPGFGAGMSRGNLYLHELGHVLGLAHVDDESMLMNPTVGSRSPDGFAKGDRRGLLALGC
jgi:hypothetical protein